jgi:1,4-alpha-glucan branching enzyme
VTDASWDSLAGDARSVRELVETASRDPHALLGAHRHTVEGVPGLVVRSFHPDATSCALLFDGRVLTMVDVGGGLFAVFVPGRELPFRYRVRFRFGDQSALERVDPYQFAPTVGQLDLHLISEGKHEQLWKVMGANLRTIDGVSGASFAVWAPNARRVSLVGDFNRWDGRTLPMRSLGSSGVWELFVPGIAGAALYKFEIQTSEGAIALKADPFGREFEQSPGTASRVNESTHEWQDSDWLRAREAACLAKQPLAIYEVHLGSWARAAGESSRMLSFREIAEPLVAHVKGLGFTHLELMPIAEHTYYPSWGYLVTGYYAPTSRYGSPDDFRYFVDFCHQNGLGVLVDWVPAHFPKDDSFLRRFDGTALYEHEDPRRGEHPDWGTLIFNLGRHEVRNYLTANALFWAQEFHVDGLRFDAVASMLYLDFSRKAGEWFPNQYGGRENLEAVEFFRDVNRLLHARVPGAFTVAEESTAWPGVTRSPEWGGLGFDFKWNMGWMHDTLDFFEREPVHRRGHLDRLAFAMVYEYSEHFINAISHDEVVYGKRSLVAKMPGDEWQRLANVRLLLAYQFTRPGKKLVFMGAEIAQANEWNVDAALDLETAGRVQANAMRAFVSELGQLYRISPALWQEDTNPGGFEWIDCTDRENGVVSYLRAAGDDRLIIVLNFTPTTHEGYRIGVPAPGRYRAIFSSDELRFGGSGVTQGCVASESIGCHGRAQSLCIRVPPLAAAIFRREP